MDLEIRGIDIKVHGEPAYPNAAYGHGWDNEGPDSKWSQSFDSKLNFKLFSFMNLMYKFRILAKANFH